VAASLSAKQTLITFSWGGQLPLILLLCYHPQKIQICKLSQGVDFLGYVQFQHHRLLRKTTQNRMIRKLAKKKPGFPEPGNLF